MCGMMRTEKYLEHVSLNPAFRIYPVDGTSISRSSTLAEFILDWLCYDLLESYPSSQTVLSPLRNRFERRQRHPRMPDVCFSGRPTKRKSERKGGLKTPGRAN
jgi:hypothetical protein